MPVFDYVVSKPNAKLDLGSGTEFVPHGSRLHGEHVESWGMSVADRLVSGGLLSRVPHDADAEHYGWSTGAPKVAEPEVEEPEDEGEPDADEVAFPRHTGFGRYELSDGSTVQGKDAAIKAQAELEVDADADDANDGDDESEDDA